MKGPSRYIASSLQRVHKGGPVIALPAMTTGHFRAREIGPEPKCGRINYAGCGE